jgi:hypothetical protein
MQVGAVDAESRVASDTTRMDASDDDAPASLNESHLVHAQRQEILEKLKRGPNIRLLLAARGSLVPATLRMCGSSWSHGTFSICARAPPSG